MKTFSSDAFMCPVDPVRNASSKLLDNWTRINKSKCFARQSEDGLDYIDSQNLQACVDTYFRSASTCWRIILNEEKFSAVQLPNIMSWDSGEALLSLAVEHRRIELVSWGYEDRRCLMIYGDVAEARRLKLPLDLWSERPLSIGRALDTCTAAIGGWTVKCGSITQVLRALTEEFSAIVFSDQVDLAREIIKYESKLLSPKEAVINEAFDRYSLPTDVELFAFQYLDAESVNRVLERSKVDGAFRIVIFPRMDENYIDKYLAASLLMYESNDFLSDRYLDRFRWYVTINCFDSSALWLTFRGRSNDGATAAARSRLAAIFGTDDCVVW